MRKTKKQMLPRRDFVAQTVGKWDGHAHDIKGTAGDPFPYPEDPVLSSSPLAAVNYATLFAYMHRRFGPPHIGGDDYKDLSASWVLSTPEPDILVSVSPSLSGTWFSFSPYLVSAERLAPEALASQFERIKAAYGDLLMDLLRPVCVRDSHINALGPLGDDELSASLFARDKKSGESIFAVKYAASSGYPMPLGLFGNPGWAALVGIIRTFDPSNMEQATRKAVETLQGLALPDLGAAQWPIQRLVLLGAWSEKAELAEKAGLDQACVARLEAEVAAILSDEDPDFSVVGEMTDDRVAAANHLLARLGYGSRSELNGAVHNYRRRAAGAAVLAELREALGDRDTALITPAAPWVSVDAYAEEIAALGDEKLKTWAEAAIGDKYRRQAFQNIAWNLHHAAKKATKTEELAP
jgi:hypothetical protein